MSKANIKKLNNNEYSISGELDAESVMTIIPELDSIFSDLQHALRIDLGAISYSSSVGIALLLKCMRQAEEAKQPLSFVNMPKKMQAIVEICGLSDIVPIK